MTHD